MKNSENLIIIAFGPLAAILLGMVLVPFRNVTSASNMTFLFLILTILIAEYGGRWAAFATALSSAVSLDFFLTEPYLRLAIKGIHDIIAFAGLTVCGLMVAAFSSRRGKDESELSSLHGQLDLLHAAASNLTSAARLEAQLGKVLDALRSCFPLRAAAIRDESNKVLAAFAARSAATPVPAQVLSPQTLVLNGTVTEGRQAVPFPSEGGRVILVGGGRHIGWMDLWGNGAPATVEMRRTLSDAALLIACLLDARRRDAGRQQ